MRVIAGKFKGRVLFTLKGDDVRPTGDRQKESLFAILEPLLSNGATVLDLFGGTGNLAIEALSRGASYATIVDSSAESIKTIKRNLEHVGARAETVLSDALLFLSRSGRKYDIIFIDPPYYTNLAEEALGLLDERALIGKVAVVETDRELSFGNLKYIEMYDRRNYGRTSLLFFREKK